MKKLILFFALMIPVASLADGAVAAKMKYHVVNGQRAFGAQWFSGARLGIVNLGLVWSEYDDSVKEGFVLDSATAAEFISPQLPAGCSVKSLKGTLNWLKEGTSPVGITVVGETCEKFIEDIKSAQIEIVFSDVKHQTGEARSERLHLHVVESP